ncbi:MAG: hypothetical protein QF464_22270, partial [Myxococcota bacterium]|nr:hypothetical protein [Myxococcota bacterium]
MTATQAFRGELNGIRVVQSDAELISPRVSVDYDATLADGRLAVRGEVASPSLTLYFGDQTLKISGLKQRMEATSDVKEGVGAQLRVRSDAQRIEHPWFSTYPIEGAALSLDIRRARPGVIRLVRLQASNRAAGTLLTLRGGLDRSAPTARRLGAISVAPAASRDGSVETVPGKHGVSLTGSLHQDISVLSQSNSALSGRGQVSIPFSVRSADFDVVHSAARVKFDDVVIKMRDKSLEIGEINGSIPIYQEISLRAGLGDRTLRNATQSAYSRWHYHEHQAFLGSDHFISIDRVIIDRNPIGPFAANLKIDRNLFHLDQLEFGLLGGKVTGQTLIRYLGKDTELTFRGNATGLRPSQGGDRLDANGALTFALGHMALDGRV